MLLAVDVGNTNTVLGLYRLDEQAGLPPKGAPVPAKDRVDLLRTGASPPIATRPWMSTASFL